MHMKKGTYAVKAKTIIPMIGEKAARGPQLFTTLTKIDNGILLIHDGRVLSVGKAKNLRLPEYCPIEDLGYTTIIPGPINAHVHLDLSYLAGKTLFHKGFTPWLKSLIPQLPRGQISENELVTSVKAAYQSLEDAGTRFVGNIAGSAEDLLPILDQFSKEHNVTSMHFCEWFGFTLPKDNSPWPPRVYGDITRTPSLVDHAMPGGHALYSTAPELLQRASEYCQSHKQVFTMHLAESPEETEMLTKGTGTLYELYRQRVLSPFWQAPKMPPLAYALHLNLLGPHFLAVHGTQLDSQEAQVLAMKGASLCLCPRSNANLNVGTPDIHSFIAENVLLCLGTDGLSSNTDLNVIQEAVFLREHFDTPKEALIRMLTVNGAHALHLDVTQAQLDVGSHAHFAILPEELTA